MNTLKQSKAPSFRSLAFCVSPTRPYRKVVWFPIPVNLEPLTGYAGLVNEDKGSQQ